MAIVARRRYLGDQNDGIPYSPVDPSISGQPATGSIWDWLMGTDEGQYGSGESTFSDFLTVATTGQLSPHQSDMLAANAYNEMIQAGGTPQQAQASANSTTTLLQKQNA